MTSLGGGGGVGLFPGCMKIDVHWWEGEQGDGEGRGCGCCG